MYRKFIALAKIKFKWILNVPLYPQILQTLAGSGNIRVNIVGGTPQQQQQAANLVTSISPALQVVSGSLQGQPVAPSAEKTLLSTATTGAQSTAPAVTASILPLPGISLGGLTPSSNAQTTGTGGGNVTVVGGNNNHLLSTISSVIMNSGRRNVTGIVDESLRIATPAPIREFVTGILGVVYCNSIRRLLGRC